MSARPPDPESEFFRRVKRRDYRRALELLAEAYARPLGRLCFSLVGSQAEAEELVQESLLAAYEAMPGFEGRSSARTWLFTIARRTCGRLLEKRDRRCRLLSAREPEEREAEDPLRIVVARGEHERLRDALARLPVAQQEMLLLRYASELSFHEAAEICGIREDAARQRASQGLRALRRELGGKDARARATAAAASSAAGELDGEAAPEPAAVFEEHKR
jgi:RNA polymerase sigma-70 factor, ECF subfamily